MPDPTFIPGYLGTVLLNTDDISAIGSVVSLSKTRNIMTKPTFGSPYAFSLGGQKLGSFSAQGHVSVEQIADIDNAFNSDAPIAFSLQIGDAAGTTDAGLYAGMCVLSDYTIEANADGEWDWSIEAQTSGPIAYTAPTREMSVEINVVGLDLVHRNLKAVDHQLPRGLTKIHKEVAEPVSKKAKPKVNSRTGALERTIKPSGTQRGAFVMAGRGLAYGAVNHYGGYPGDYPGNPFLTETLTEESTESVRLYERLLGNFLESVWQDS